MGPVQREIYDFIENKYLGYFQENQNDAGRLRSLRRLALFA
jgi:hypothetical protein